MVEKYRERYRVKGLWESRAYDGIPELLKKLRDCGVKTATASSKPEQFIISILKKNNLYDYFDYVGGVTFDEIRSDKTQLGSSKNDAVMVGDRKFDIDGAKGAGIPCIAVLYGFGSLEEFREHKADYIVSTPAEIEKLIISG